MVYLLIFLFFITLFLFFLTSGLWHWVWFGGGMNKHGQSLARRIRYFKRQENDAETAARRFARVATTLMVLVSITGLGVVTYLLIS